MPADRDERIADFVKPFRVKPRSEVSLGKDFDPAFKVGSKKQGQECCRAALTCWLSISPGCTRMTLTACSLCFKRSTLPVRTERFGM